MVFKLIHLFRIPCFSSDCLTALNSPSLTIQKVCQNSPPAILAETTTCFPLAHYTIQPPTTIGNTTISVYPEVGTYLPPGMRTPFRGRGRPRPRSVWHKPHDYVVLMETTRLASLSINNILYGNRVVKHKQLYGK